MSAEDEKAFAAEIHKAIRLRRNLLSPARIKAVREASGLSQQALSDFLGGGTRSLYRYEHDLVQPSKAMNGSLHILGNRPELTKVFLKLPRDEMLPAEITAIREGLGLGKREAGRIFGGGPRAFQKYERGLVKPREGMVRLLRLVHRHPELLSELGYAQAKKSTRGKRQWPPTKLKAKLRKGIKKAECAVAVIESEKQARQLRNRRLILRYRELPPSDALFGMLERPPKVDAQLRAFHEATIFMKQAALSAMSSPDHFVAAISRARVTPPHALCAEEISYYRNGLETAFAGCFQAVRSFLPTKVVLPPGVENLRFKPVVLDSNFLKEEEFLPECVVLLRERYRSLSAFERETSCRRKR